MNTTLPKKRQFKTLNLIQFDQLNRSLEILKDGPDTESLYCFIEPWSYLKARQHHKKKVLLILMAMRSFASYLQELGYCLCYFKLDHQDNFEERCFSTLRDDFDFQQVQYVKSSEWGLEQQQKSQVNKLELQTKVYENNLFLCSIDDFNNWAKNRKELVMEHFYRQMRKDHDILITQGQPIGGHWNFDKENRQRPPKHLDKIQPFCAHLGPKEKDLETQAIEDIEQSFANYYGESTNFHFPATTQAAQEALEYFCQHHLSNFGRYQDIMMQENPWLFHAHISFPLNLGLITPKECLNKAIRAFESGEAPLNAVEGFIRQILGWREFIRGVYWLKMPGYEHSNYLDAQRSLPDFFWKKDASTMNCLNQSFKQTYELAYAHHIQRLMVIGNFSLLCSLNPQQVDNWFAIVYADAYQWVHLPNVLGMSLYADGGVFATKPYISSGAYINKMSNYCQFCQYSVKEKLGPKACPFNYLYWHFLATHREKFGHNHRMRMIYATYDKMSEHQKDAISQQAEAFLKTLNS